MRPCTIALRYCKRCTTGNATDFFGAWRVLGTYEQYWGYVLCRIGSSIACRTTTGRWSLSISVIVCLTITGTYCLHRIAHIIRSLKLCKNRIRSLLNRLGILKRIYKWGVALCELFPQKIKLHIKISNGLAICLGIIEQILLARRISPLCQTVACVIIDKVSICTVIYRSRIRSIRITKGAFICVLEIIGNQNRLGIKITHNTGSTIGIICFAI